MDYQPQLHSSEEHSKIQPEDAFPIDIEDKVIADSHLLNDTAKSFLWRGVTVTVKDNKAQQFKAILDNIDGIVQAGEICALMGPSGCGKTTLLNVLARRDAAAQAKVEGVTLVNGDHPTIQSFWRLTSYVEQEDALIGSLTVRETIYFAARLAHKNSLTKAARMSRINALLESFGLRAQENNIVGTPIRKGISGGQKRRLSVASQLITAPKILFLDEPTTGLDSAASFEVMSFVKNIAKTNNLIVIASIHQPSTTTFKLFDKLLLLSQGKTQYFGEIGGVGQHFASLGFPMPTHTNPAEFILELINIDFAIHQEEAIARLQTIQKGWSQSSRAAELCTKIELASQATDPLPPTKQMRRTFFIVLSTLVHRSFVKSYRDVVAYGIRIAMYLGLAIMMGTVWLRLEAGQSSIQPFTNAIFFGGAFMSFMAVAYVPSFLEDRATFVKERENGLYGASEFMLSNFIVGVPYLFLITVIFSIVVYWLSNFNPTAPAFFTWIMWLFLDLLAAESLVVLISSIFPNFVVSLALTAFANGLWMSVNGFMVPPRILNVFWRYVFHYIDYQSYVFQGMMVNEFGDRSYSCGKDCNCMYQSELAPQCRVTGVAVLDQYGYKTGKTGEWAGILVGIIVVYRLLGFLVLILRMK